MRRLLQFVLASLLLCAARAGDADTDWKAVLALDAGPPPSEKAPANAQAIVLDHLAKQERVLRAFLAAHADDARAFEARLRLARLLTMRAMIAGGKNADEGARLLDEMEKTATPAQLTEIEFTRLAGAMRAAQKPTGPQREALLASARHFQSAHPDDPRLAALLAEIALLFETAPETMRALLLDAQTLAHDEELKHGIADDLRRVGLVGQPVKLDFKAAGGRAVSLADYHGKAVLLVFFAVWSEPSTEAIAGLQVAAGTLPKDRVQLLGISLDTKPEKLTEFVRTKKIAWPIWCDNKGWESPLVRTLGINALPTVWLLDPEGHLRSLNALEDTAAQVRQALAK